MAGDVAAGAVTGPGRGVRVASAADDAGIRELLRRSVIPGAVRVAFTREPAYAAGAGLAGGEDATVVFEHDGRVAALGRCTVRTVWRNGRLCLAAYLSELRADPGVRGAVAGLRDGFARLADWAVERGAEGFYTTIVDDNARARAVLERGGRLGLPVYRPAASLVTLVAPVTRVEPGRAEPPPDAVELQTFLAGQAPLAHLSLPWTSGAWSALAAHGIGPADFAVARRAGRVVAVAGVWDQRAFRQTVIDGLSGALGALRPVVNRVRRWRGLPDVPAPGAVMPLASVLAAAVPDARDWAAVWSEVGRLARRRGVEWVSMTFDRRDPAVAVVRRLVGPREYASTLYDVAWRDRPSWADGWDARMFRPDAGLL